MGPTVGAGRARAGGGVHLPRPPTPAGTQGAPQRAFLLAFFAEFRREEIP